MSARSALIPTLALITFVTGLCPAHAASRSPTGTGAHLARRSGSRSKQSRFPTPARLLSAHGPATRRLIFDQEFEGPAGQPPESAVWEADTGGSGWGEEQLQSYTGRPSNASLDGHGDLAIVARHEPFAAARDRVPSTYTSARLQTLHSFSFEHGLIEARIRVPAGPGLVSQFWALGEEAYAREHAWPGCGEIDAMEVLGAQPGAVRGHLHAPWPWAPNQGLGRTASAGVSLAAGFHTYQVSWQAGRVSFALDGRVYETVSRSELPAGAPWPFEHHFFLLIDLAVGGNWPGAPTASTPLPATLLVDWIRVWQ